MPTMPNKGKAPHVAVPASFVAPHWGNVFPPPAVLVPTGDPKIDEALRKVLDGTADAAAQELAATAPTSALIANCRGAAIAGVTVYWNDDVVKTLAPAQKKAQKKVYWDAEKARGDRETLFLWMTTALATTPEGRAHLVSILGDATAAPSLRGRAALKLRTDRPDAALWRAIAREADPASWSGVCDVESSAHLEHAYAVGAMAALAIDPDAAIARFAPLLAVAPTEGIPDPVTVRATAVLWGITAALQDGVVSPAAGARFMTPLIELLPNLALRYQAITALKLLPEDPAIIEAAQRMLGPTPLEVTYWDQSAVELLARSSDPKYIPWLATALCANWMTWPHVFPALGRMGDPVGAAVIEKWIDGTTAPDRVVAAKPILADLYERAGEPTAAHRATAAELLSHQFTAWGTLIQKKPTKKKKKN